MKNKTVKTLLAVCIGSLIIGCNDKAGETTTAVSVDKEQIKKEIQAKEDEFASSV